MCVYLFPYVHTVIPCLIISTKFIVWRNTGVFSWREKESLIFSIVAGSIDLFFILDLILLQVRVKWSFLACSQTQWMAVYGMGFFVIYYHLISFKIIFSWLVVSGFQIAVFCCFFMLLVFWDFKMLYGLGKKSKCMTLLDTLPCNVGLVAMSVSWKYNFFNLLIYS